jgi:hypothetical protein
MIGLLFSLAAAVPAVILATRIHRHRPVAFSLALSCVYAAAHAHLDERARLAAVVLIAGGSAYASLGVWAPRYRLAALAWLLVAGAVLAGAADGAWTVATWGPRGLAVAVGLAAWLTAVDEPTSVVTLVAVGVLLGDAAAVAGACMSAWVSAYQPSPAFAYAGRAQAVVLASVQVVALAATAATAARSRCRASAASREQRPRAPR